MSSKAIDPRTVALPVVAQATAIETDRAKQVLAAIESIEVKTPQHIEMVAPLLLDIKRAGKQITAQKEETTKPLNAELRAIREYYKPAEDAYSKAEAILKGKISKAQQAIMEENQRAAYATQQALAAGQVLQAATLSSAIVNTEAPKGITYREQYTFRIVDEKLLPREFLMPDEKKIREYVAQYGQQHPIPGVVVEKTVGVIARTT